MFCFQVSLHPEAFQRPMLTKRNIITAKVVDRRVRLDRRRRQGFSWGADGSLSFAFLPPPKAGWFQHLNNNLKQPCPIISHGRATQQRPPLSSSSFSSLGPAWLQHFVARRREGGSRGEGDAQTLPYQQTHRQWTPVCV